MPMKELLRIGELIGIATVVVVGLWQLNPWIFVGLGCYACMRDRQQRRA
jgi:hypothetical protein